MPGLIGLADTRGGADAARRFELARHRMLRGGRSVAEQCCASEGGVIGRTGLRRSSSPYGSDAVAMPIAEPRVMFYGVLHNEAALGATLDGGSDPGAAHDTTAATSVDRLLSRLYARHGDDFVARLEGEFALLVLDPARHRILAATDAVGNYPVFWHDGAGGLVVSTDLGALLAAMAGGARLDLRAVADYLTCGMVLGDKTLAEHVRALDAGTLLAHDLRRGQSSVRRYFDPSSFFEPKATNKREYLEAVTAAFTQAVGRAIEGGGRVCLSLSGGLDSRAILSAAASKAGTLDTYTLGVDGCADQVIGDRLARIAGTRHTFFPLHSGYLGDFVPNMAEMVAMTGGMYLSHGLTEILALQFLAEKNADVLVRGHGGELAKAHLAWPLHTDRHVHTLHSTDQLVGYLATRANYITPRLPLSQILTSRAAAIAGDGAAQSFRDVLSHTSLSPADCCSYLYLHEHHRRFTVPSLDLFRSAVEVRLPFVDPMFLRILLTAPPEWRESTEIHRRITAAGIPALGGVRDSNTGAPANAGPAATFVLDKVNSLFKRLNVPGYRHYHDFDHWMRRELLASVEAELLSPAARVQAFVSKPVLSGLVNETQTGSTDHSYLLQVLLILELWQRQNHVEAAV